VLAFPGSPAGRGNQKDTLKEVERQPEDVMDQYTQDRSLIAVTTPLGKDVLLLTAFEGEEALSRPFSYRLEMLSANPNIAAKDIVGKSVTWMVRRTNREPRYFNGIVCRFAAGGTQIRGLRYYRAEVVPWLWFLGRTADCRIFQEKAAPNIIEQIFKDLGYTAYELSLKSTYVKREYCVQYRETDLNFVSRLMEQEGIFYYFRHENGKHTLVLADQKTAFKDCPEKEVEGSVGSHSTGQVTGWEHQYEFRPGKWAQTDYNFETPSTSLMSTTKSVVSLPGVEKFEIYDYPGLYLKKPDGDTLTKIRMEEEETAYEVVKGASTCSTFTPGGKFKLKSFTSTAEAGKSYVITSIQHSARESSYSPTELKSQDYSNTFDCIPDSVAFRPARCTAKPVVQGPQTAVVVGPQGEEIYVDKYGRVKVQFFWDREGKKNENSSCWMRVAQGWAGKNWGMMFIPRIGHEVVVDFLEGDPDRPLITGCVYNAEQMPPYDLPANQTRSVIKSRSSKGGSTPNFNELRFEDKKDSEEVYFHAEKDFNRVVENNDTLKVGFEKKDKGDQTIDIFNNQKITIGAGKSQAADGSQTIDIFNNQQLTVGSGKAQASGGSQTLSIYKDRTSTIETGNDTHTIKMGNRSVQIDMGNDSLTIKMGNQTTKLNLGKSETEAMQSIELKVGQSSVKVDQMGVTIKGLMIHIEGQIQTQVKALMTQVTADAMLQMKGAITMIG
jgi:type VI secretion system secreted protein VgrG